LALARYRPEIVDITWETDVRTKSGADECIALGSGSMTAADAQLTVFEMRPSLVGPTGSQASAYRSFFMQLLFRAPGLPVTDTCTESGTAMLPFQTFFEGGLRNAPFGLSEVSADGVSFNETWEIGDTTFTLDLLGIADP
jgi:hypothetical protein